MHWRFSQTGWNIYLLSDVVEHILRFMKMSPRLTVVLEQII